MEKHFKRNREVLKINKLRLFFGFFCTFIFANCSKKNFNDNNPALTPNAPVISSINPIRAQYGSAITIKGRHFGNNANDITITLNSSNISPQTINDSTLTFVLPKGAGSGNVAVRKISLTSNTVPFEYLFTGLTSLYAGNGNTSPATGTATNVGFNQLEGFDVDSTGAMYVCDFLSQRIMKINSGNGTVSFYMGFIPGVGGTSHVPSNFRPTDISFGIGGNAYITSGDHRVCRFNAATNYSSLAGIGQAGYSNTIAYASMFNLPRAIKFINSTTLLVNDLNNHCIRQIDPTNSTTFVTTLSGTNIAGDAVGTAANTRFNTIGFITREDANNLLIADFNNAKIKRVNISTGASSTVVGSSAGNVLGPVATAQISKPNCALKDAAGNIFISEFESGYIKCISPSGYVYNLVGDGTITGYAEGAGTAAKFKQLGKLVPAGNNAFYIADMGNRRIRRVILE